MIGKKLITLACAVGILLCGACFRAAYAPPPTPPLRPLAGIRSIYVTVANQSAARHLEPGELSQRLADAFNWKTIQTHLEAQTSGDTAATDAVLAISVLDEDGGPTDRPAGQDSVVWAFHFKVSSTLTRRDGQLIWSDAGSSYTAFYSFHKTGRPDFAPGWDQPGLARSLGDQVARQLVNKLVFLP